MGDVTDGRERDGCESERVEGALVEGSGGVPALRYRREMKKDRDACRFFVDIESSLKYNLITDAAFGRHK